MNKFTSKLATHKTGLKAEKQSGKKLGGRVNAGSGAMEGLKGDITLAAFLIENKSTINRSLSLKLDWLQKIRHEAMNVNRYPALAIQFTDGEGTPDKDAGSWVMVPAHLWGELTRGAE